MMLKVPPVIFRAVLPVPSPVSGTEKYLRLEWNLTGWKTERKQLAG